MLSRLLALKALCVVLVGPQPGPISSTPDQTLCFVHVASNVCVVQSEELSIGILFSIGWSMFRVVVKVLDAPTRPTYARVTFESKFKNKENACLNRLGPAPGPPWEKYETNPQSVCLNRLGPGFQGTSTTF